jgi:hypothetical protein
MLGHPDAARFARDVEDHKGVVWKDPNRRPMPGRNADHAAPAASSAACQAATAAQAGHGVQVCVGTAVQQGVSP